MSSVYSPYGGMQFLPCQRCQTALPPTEPLCRNCGYNNAPNQGNNPIAPQPVAPPMNGPWGGESIPQPVPQQGQTPYGSAAWGQPPVAPSPTVPSPQAPTSVKPASSGLLRSSGGNFFGVTGAPAPITQDNLDQGAYLQSSSFASPPSGVFPSNNPPSQAPYNMSPSNNPPSFGGGMQPPTGFAAPNPVPNPPSGTLYSGMPGMVSNNPNTPSYAQQSQSPVGFGASNTTSNPPSGTLYNGMPGMASNMPTYGAQGQPSAGFVAPTTAPNPPSGALYTANPPSGTLYTGMPGMVPNNNMPSYAQQGQPPTGFAAPNMVPNPPSGALYNGMPGMAFNNPNMPPPSAQQANGSSMPPPAFNEKSARRGPKPWAVVLIVLLIIALAGGGFLGYTWLSARNSSTATNQPSSGTSTVPKGTPLFADTFKDNANKWSLQSYPPRYAISIANNSLVIEDNQNYLLWELVPGNKTYDDFTLSVDGMLSQGQQNNGYGIYIRGGAIQNSELVTYYRFEFYGDGTYAIFKGAQDATGKLLSPKLTDYTLNTAIHKEGTLNHIQLTAKGSSLSLTINGQVIKTLTDTSYARGSIALFVSNLKNVTGGAQAKFSNLAIYPA